jgi:hypothetical protein
MHPGCFQAVILLLSAKLQQQAFIVVAVANAAFAKNSFLDRASGIEVAKDYTLSSAGVRCSE